MTWPRILVTGSRTFADAAALREALVDAAHKYAGGGPATLVSGGCPSGADHLAETFWHEMGLPVEVHRADWGAHGRAAGPRRNQQMVDLGAAVCVAFPTADSRGTWDCVRRAEAAGIPVVIHQDG